MRLHTLYYPLTAAPFPGAARHVETPPSAPLRPYIRCFWGPPKPGPDGISAEGELVIPDTCMDLIFELNAERGERSARFCTLNDRPFYSRGAPPGDRFAIRFYPWTASMLTGESLAGSRNGCFDGAELFPRLTRETLRVLEETPDYETRCRRTERLLGELLQSPSFSAECMNALELVLRREGRVGVEEAAAFACVSRRHLERRFAAAFGLTPKTLFRLTRYQLLWQSAATDPTFSQADAAYRFGYVDQAHMANEFRSFHSMSLQKALRYMHRPYGAQSGEK